jgi:chemotaxis protein CheD
MKISETNPSTTVHLNIGDYHFDKEPVLMKTVLGSCVSVCLFNPNIPNHAGMNHIFLPGKSSIERNDKNARYGIHAMEILINEFIKSGIPRTKLHAKIFGGGYIVDLGIKNESDSIGTRNINFVREFLEMEKIPIVSSDVGGRFCRSVHFNTSNYDVIVRKHTPNQSQEVIKKEQDYHLSLNPSKRNKTSKVTLF